MDFISSDNCTFGMKITDNSLIFQVNKEVLKTLAEKAQYAGADIYFSTSVEDLLHTKNE